MISQASSILFFAYLLEFACEDMILGGDFNLVLDLTVDKKGGNETGQINQIRTEETHDECLHDNTVNNALLWEMIKFKTREHSIKYATAKRDKILRRAEELEKEINTLPNFIDSMKVRVLRPLSIVSRPM